MTINEDSSHSSIAYRPAGVIRRIGAMTYDALLVIAVLAIASTPFQVYSIVHKKLLLSNEAGWWISGAFWLWLIVVFIWFFGFFWTRRGQTLGLQVWRLRVEDERGELLSWPLAVRRLAFAALLWLPGFLVLSISEKVHSTFLKWSGEALLLLVLVNLITARFSASHRTWHDRMALSRVVSTSEPQSAP